MSAADAHCRTRLWMNRFTCPAAGESDCAIVSPWQTGHITWFSRLASEVFGVQAAAGAASASAETPATSNFTS